MTVGVMKSPGHGKAKQHGDYVAGDSQSVAATATKNNEPPRQALHLGRPGLFSRLFFLFVDRLIKHGHRTTLEVEDLYSPPGLDAATVHGRFDAAWRRELKRRDTGGEPDIRRAVVANSLAGLIITGGLYCVSLASQLVGPMMLQRIVAGLQCWAAAGGARGGTCPTNGDLYYYVIAICLAPLVQSLAENQMQFQLNIVGLKMRNGLMAAIYRKCLRLSNSALQSESTGKVVTLMSNDAQKVQDVMLAIHTLWGAPALIVVTLVLLYQQVGWATFVGLAVMAAYTPVSAKVSTRLIRYRRALMVWTDKRVGLMNEVVNSIHMIKFYAWESSFKSSVMALRDKEAAILRSLIWWQALFSMVLFSGPVMMAVAVFATYALAGNALTAASAYTSLALFNLLRLPLAFLPMMVTMLVNALIALGRIRDFLLKPESGLDALRAAADATAPGLVQVEDASFTWEAEGTTASLHDVSFTAAPGTLTMIVGGVGSGKSSVLAALIGQMERLSGRVAVGGRVAYVAQTAWIVNDSVQENVVMGEAFDVSRYQVTVDVAALLPDLALLPKGDATEIGDRGINLSGGQKQRVSLARAVYSDADVYLLDDPLSAVDSHVGRSLFERVIRGVLAGKTVLLVTNALQWLPMADNVVWMEGGRVRGQGRYQELVEQGLNVAELVHMENDETDQSDSDGADLDGTELWEPALRVPSELTPARDAADAAAATADGVSANVVQVQVRATGSESGGGAQPITTAADIVVAAGSDEADDIGGGGLPALPRPASAHSLTGPRSSSKKVSPLSSGGGSRMRRGGSASHLPAADPASAGSLSGAALRVASGLGGPPPRSLSLVRLAAEENRNLTGVEAREQGRISGTVLGTYVQASGGFIIAAVIVVIMALEQGARVFTDTWLGMWAANTFGQGMWFYIGIYTAAGVTYSLITFIRTLRFMYTTVGAAVSLHNALLSHLLRLPKSFFDTNPAGRILNRFSRDVETMDSVLNQSMSQFTNCFAAYLAILVVISMATRWFGIAILPITIIYILLQRYYIPAARELQRIESITRSPIYSRFSEALAGAATIRAYRREAYFTSASDDLMETNARAFVSQRAAASWLAMRLDFMGLIILTVAAVLCIRGGIPPGLAGLCLVYALDLTRYLKHGTAMASKTESDFNSVERVVQYLEPAPEAAEETAPAVESMLPAGWPTAGALSVSALSVRYRPGLPLVLKGVSFDVAGGEKVGLVGRTGSGKSSLLLALFRMVEPDGGSIRIDGVDIATLGLARLRGALSIIPQDPFMFSGTVRSNLDPFGRHGDDELWQVLRGVGLADTISALESKLGAPVVDGGNNFSQGQKQLFCMARAMLRDSRLLMLDEATASVDPETDRTIQTAIRSAFSSTTMLTIAHRLNTIMDADRVLVLDGGRLLENGEPHALLQSNRGLFSGMVSQTGSAASAYLRDVAREASMTRATAASAALAAGSAPSAAALSLALARGGGGVPGASAGSICLGRPQHGRDGYDDEDDDCISGASAAGAQRAAGRVTRAPSELGLGRYAAQDPMQAFMAAGPALTRELSLLQRNAQDGQLGQLGRRLSFDVAATAVAEDEDPSTGSNGAPAGAPPRRRNGGGTLRRNGAP